MQPFSSRLATAHQTVGSPLCVGLDPDLARLPSSLTDASSADRVRSFCFAITESTAHVAAAYKPNLAFFEALGPDGWHVLADVCDRVRQSGRLLILDGKRGDIGNTGRRYATALYDQLGGDASTVAPYMGHDSIAPFLEHEGRCAFVLVATSNPGGAEYQQLEVDGLPLYRHIADAITSGTLEPGSQLPPERDLADRADVSRVTVRKAIHALAKGGAVINTCSIKGMKWAELDTPEDFENVTNLFGAD